MTSWYHQNIDASFFKIRQKIYSLLQQESKLIEIAQLVGADVLPDDQKLVLEIAKVIKVGFLQQNAYHKDDTNVPLTKQLKMMDVIIKLYEIAKLLISSGTPLSQLMETTDIFEKHIITFLQNHIRSWDSTYAFNGEDEVIDFFNDAIENGEIIKEES